MSIKTLFQEKGRRPHQKSPLALCVCVKKREEKIKDEDIKAARSDGRGGSACTHESSGSKTNKINNLETVHTTMYVYVIHEKNLDPLELVKGLHF